MGEIDKRLQLIQDIAKPRLCKDAEVLLVEAIEENAVAALQDEDGVFGIFKIKGKAIMLATRDVKALDGSSILQRGCWYINPTDKETEPFLKEMDNGATHIMAEKSRWVFLRVAGQAQDGIPFYTREGILQCAEDGIAKLNDYQPTAGKSKEHPLPREAYRRLHRESRFAGEFPL